MRWTATKQQVSVTKKDIFTVLPVATNCPRNVKSVAAMGIVIEGNSKSDSYPDSRNREIGTVTEAIQ